MSSDVSACARDGTSERAPVQVGDTVWLVRSLFGIGTDVPGVVVRADIPVARAYRVGWDSCGIIEVAFAAADRRVQSHWTHFRGELPRDGNA